MYKVTVLQNNSITFVIVDHQVITILIAIISNIIIVVTVE